MNQKNLEYLSDQVKFTGFGEGLENELKEKMEQQTPDFQIAHKTKFGNDDVSSVLHFKKSDQTDMDHHKGRNYLVRRICQFQTNHTLRRILR